MDVCLYSPSWTADPFIFLRASTGFAPAPSLQESGPQVKEVTLHALQSSATGPDRAAWQDLVQTGRLHERTPEEIVAASRRLDPGKDERLLGQLMVHVSVLATRYLARRINPNRPNRGKDALENVRTGMLTAILDPTSADGRGTKRHFTQS